MHSACQAMMGNSSSHCHVYVPYLQVEVYRTQPIAAREDLKGNDAEATAALADEKPGTDEEVKEGKSVKTTLNFDKAVLRGQRLKSDKYNEEFMTVTKALAAL